MQHDIEQFFIFSKAIVFSINQKNLDLYRNYNSNVFASIILHEKLETN